MKKSVEARISLFGFLATDAAASPASMNYASYCWLSNFEAWMPVKKTVGLNRPLPETFMSRSFDVAVIGLGAMGSATLHALAMRGVRAIGLEQFEPGHDRGSSHGESRVIRLSYYEHPGYVPLLRRAYRLWDALDYGACSKVLTRTGIIEAGVPGSDIVAGSMLASDRYGISHERLTGDEISRRFGAFDIPSDWRGLYQADGGYIRPEMAIRRFVSRAEQHGADVSTNAHVSRVESAEDWVSVHARLETIRAKAVVLTAGAWTPTLLPNLPIALTVTRQTIAWYRPHRPDYYTPKVCPVFIFDAGKRKTAPTQDNVCYGFPDFNGTGVKVASHAEGPAVEDLDGAGKADGRESLAVREMLEAHLKGANGTFLRADTCLYTNTSDGHFVIDRSPNDRRIIVASPCSGHGFKFASVIGEHLADMALDRPTEFDLDGFTTDAAKRWPPRPKIAQ